MFTRVTYVKKIVYQSYMYTNVALMIVSLLESKFKIIVSDAIVNLYKVSFDLRTLRMYKHLVFIICRVNKFRMQIFSCST